MKNYSPITCPFPVCIGLILFCLVLTASADEPRQWTSRDGSATLTARFFRQSGDNVTLILPNGRSQVVKRDFLSEADIAWIDASAAEQTQEEQMASAGAKATAKIPSALKGRLIDADGKPANLENAAGFVPKYYLFYYSASWCGPCVAFTPELVRFYNRMEASNPELIVVLVSNDKSGDDALAYMKNARMPFPGVEYDKLSRSGIPGNPGNSIPALRLTDENGTDILTTTGTSRDQFLEEAKKLITAKSEI
jgi:thiol-disulfide isomerase/thioredoxin